MGPGPLDFAVFGGVVVQAQGRHGEIGIGGVVGLKLGGKGAGVPDLQHSLHILVHLVPVAEHQVPRAAVGAGGVEDALPGHQALDDVKFGEHRRHGDVDPLVLCPAPIPADQVGDPGHDVVGLGRLVVADAAGGPLGGARVQLAGHGGNLHRIQQEDDSRGLADVLVDGAHGILVVQILTGGVEEHEGEGVDGIPEQALVPELQLEDQGPVGAVVGILQAALGQIQFHAVHIQVAVKAGLPALIAVGEALHGAAQADGDPLDQLLDDHANEVALAGGTPAHHGDNHIPAGQGAFRQLIVAGGADPLGGGAAALRAGRPGGTPLGRREGALALLGHFQVAVFVAGHLDIVKILAPLVGAAELHIGELVLVEAVGADEGAFLCHGLLPPYVIWYLEPGASRIWQLAESASLWKKTLI